MTAVAEKAAAMNTIPPGTVRLALREVREATYRALIAAGVNNSAAQAAARQVLFAEVHHATGLHALASWLRQPTSQDSLNYLRSAHPTGLTFTIDPGTRCDPLRHGALLADAASAGTGNAVLFNGMANQSHLLDEALLNAAQASGLTVVHQGAENRTTFATPAGELGTGISTPSPETLPAPDHSSRIYSTNTPPPGEFSMSTPAERTLKWTATARQGISANARTWADVRTAATVYLVADA